MSEEITELTPTTKTIEKVENFANSIFNIFNNILEKIETIPENIQHITEKELTIINNKWNAFQKIKDVSLKKGGGIDKKTFFFIPEFKEFFEKIENENIIQKLIKSLESTDETIRKNSKLALNRVYTLIVNFYNFHLVDLLTQNFKDLQTDFNKIKNIKDLRYNILTKIKNKLEFTDADIVVKVVGKELDDIKNIKVDDYVNAISTEQYQNLFDKFINLIGSRLTNLNRFQQSIKIFEIVGSVLKFTPNLIKLGGASFFIFILIEELIRDEILFDYLINKLFGVDINSIIYNEFKKDLYSFIDFIKNKKNEPINKIDLPIKKNERQI